MKSRTGSESNYPFQGISSPNFQQSLQKVQNKRTDALKWAQDEADLTIKNLKLNGIHRELWGTFDDVIMIAKGPKGEEVNWLLSDCIKKLRATGRLEQLYRKIHDPYVEWQP